MRRTFVSALLLLQVVAFAFANEQVVIGAEGSENAPTTHQPAVESEVVQPAQDTWTPYQQGWELVDAAMAEFKKIRTPFHKKIKKQSSMLGSILHYASKALPSLRVSAPPTDHRTVTLSGPLLEGVQFLQQSADQNNTDAMFLLAQLNFFGNFSHPRDLKSAFQHYLKLANLNGNSSAQYMVGLMYATGLGDAVERDQAKALLYHTFAANAGHTRAEMIVAARHQAGIGAPKNCETAAKYYKRVADKAMVWFRSGPPGGMTIIQEAYRLADEVGGVYGEGASFVSSGMNAIKAGPNSDAYAAIDDVIEYLDLMSQKGDFKASYNLGRLYYEGQRGLTRDVETARKYFQMVTSKYWRKDGRKPEKVQTGLEVWAPKAAGYIGRMHLRGEGVKQNFEKAHRWFKRGNEGSDAQSRWGLGIMALKGYGVQQNGAMATEYFKAAAEQDFTPAQVALGALYLDQGQPEDLRIANHYFEAAARYGNIEAKYYLAEMSYHGVGRDRVCGPAMYYYKDVAEKAEPLVSSWTEANQAYDEGDYELAFLDYVMAAEQGYEKAQNNAAYILDPMQSRLPLPSWLTNGKSKSNLLVNSALALVYWTRSSIQGNIDALVKMGDAYLDGVGADESVDKAAQCYAGASEHYQSAQALFNLGWMHENGVGLDQDFHLAKRYYDLALATNEEAYLPVTLSLLKLRLRSAWNTFTHGKINSIQEEPAPKKDWSLGEWIANFLQDDMLYYEDGDYDNLYDDGMAGSDGEPMGDFDDGILDSVLILGIAAVLIAAMYYRAYLQQQHRRQEQDAQAGGNAANQGAAVHGALNAAADAQAANAAAQPNRAPGQPGQPGGPEWWGAGGVGH